MRIAKVIGTVTLNRALACMRGANLKLVVPVATADLASGGEPSDESLVAWDALGAGEGSFIALSEGPEAAQPFLPEIKAIDAYNAAVLDQLDVDQTLVRILLE
ncbi:MAG: EutN/CcmL family microcompartment protein [Pirellulaceae bacterium]